MLLILAVIEAISSLRVVIWVCFSVIWDAISDLGRFLLPLVLGIVVTSFSYKNSVEQYKYLRLSPIEFITH